MSEKRDEESVPSPFQGGSSRGRGTQASRRSWEIDWTDDLRQGPPATAHRAVMVFQSGKPDYARREDIHE